MARKQTLEVEIITEVKGDQQVDRLGKKIAEFKPIIGAVGGLFAGFAATLGTVGFALADAALQAGEFAINLAREAEPLEAIGAAFEGFTRSIGVGSQDMLTNLERASAGMITQRDLMTSFNKAAQLVSLDFAERLPEAMGFLTKVSASTGESMGFLLDSLVTGVGRLSPMILDNLGIQVQLSEVTDLATQKFGVQADQLTQNQQQAALMDLILTKLQANTASIPEVTGAATNSFAAFDTMMQNLRDRVGVALLPIMQQFLSALIGLGQEILPVVLETFEQWMAAIAESEALQNLIDLVSEAARQFGQALLMALTNFGSKLVELGPLFTLMIENFARIIRALLGVEKGTGGVTATFQALEKIFDVGLKIIIKVAEALEWLADVADGIRDVVAMVDRLGGSPFLEALPEILLAAGGGLNLPFLHQGGLVPGLPGDNRLIMAAAGEQVLPANQVTHNNTFNFNSPAPIDPLGSFQMIQALTSR